MLKAEFTVVCELIEVCGAFENVRRTGVLERYIEHFCDEIARI